MNPFNEMDVWSEYLSSMQNAFDEFTNLSEEQYTKLQNLPHTLFPFLQSNIEQGASLGNMLKNELTREIITHVFPNDCDRQVVGKIHKKMLETFQTVQGRFPRNAFPNPQAIFHDIPQAREQIPAPKSQEQDEILQNLLQTDPVYMKHYEKDLDLIYEAIPKNPQAFRAYIQDKSRDWEIVKQADRRLVQTANKLFEELFRRLFERNTKRSAIQHEFECVLANERHALYSLKESATVLQEKELLEAMREKVRMNEKLYMLGKRLERLISGKSFKETYQENLKDPRRRDEKIRKQEMARLPEEIEKLEKEIVETRGEIERKKYKKRKQEQKIQKEQSQEKKEQLRYMQELRIKINREIEQDKTNIMDTEQIFLESL